VADRLGAPKPAVLAALAAIYVIWGSTYLGIMIAIDTLPPLLMASLRFLLAGGLLYAFAARGAPRPTRRHWVAATVIGAALLLGGNGGVAWAEQRIDSGIAALLVATIPLWLALFDRAAYGSRLAPSAVLGLVIGFAGVALLVRPGGGIDLLGAFVCLLAPVAWAAGSLYARGAELPPRPLLGAAMEMLAGGVLLALVGTALGEVGELRVPSWQSLTAVAYLIVFGSLVAYSCYVWLLKVAPTKLVGTYAYVNPVIAVGLGAAFLAEPITWWTALAGAAIVVSVVLIVRAPAAPRIARVETKQEGATLAA
jgi:drug/metabolite transporter (DMT)-like permease